ncbi:hypothetical protein V8E36_008133 [Tilletia maclaganii]
MQRSVLWVCIAALVAILTTLAPAAEALPFPSRWLPSLSPFVQPRAAVCNGRASYCERKFSNFTFIGAHDSFAISKWNGGVTLFEGLAANQDVSITAQLNAGIRMLQSQAHVSPNKTKTGVGIDLCHTDCALYQGGALEAYLSEVKAWTDKNPTEVISLLIVNSDNLPASQFAKAFESSGLASKSYRPKKPTGGVPRSDWPTLGSLIDAGTPVVSFLASGADDFVPYLIDEFTSIWENRYGQLTLPFDCSIDRIAKGIDPSSIMYLSNHFKDAKLLGTSILVPDKMSLSKTNSKAQVIANANNCAALYGRYPTFILVDFFNTPKTNGTVDAVVQINGR